MSFCTKCGKQNPDTNKFCIACGTALKVSTSQPSLSDPATERQNVEYDKLFGGSKKSYKSTWFILGIIALLGLGAGAYFILFNKSKKTVVDKTASNTEKVAPRPFVDTVIATSDDQSTIGMIQFKNHTDESIFLALSYPVDAPDDWRTFGWHEIKPKETFDYKSECASPELYYFAKTSNGNKIWQDNESYYVLPINTIKNSFEYHSIINPKNYEKKPFVSINYFNNNNWPLQVILE